MTPTHRGLRARDSNLSRAKRSALYQLHEPDPMLDVEAARVLEAIPYAPRTLTELVQSFNPATIVALQQRGLIRRHPGGG